MTRALVITNPAAARTDRLAVNAVMSTLKGAGWEAEVLATGGPGDARLLAEYGVADGVDVVAVFGGDGTTMQAAAALVGTDVALGVIPGGTGNLLAGNLRIPASPARAARALVSARPKQFDLGRMERPGGCPVLRRGLRGGIRRPRHGRNPLGAQATMGDGGLRRHHPPPHRRISEARCMLITIDGVEYEANAAMVLVANCGEVIPPFVRLGPGITPDDGLLDVVVVRANSFSQSVRAVWELLRVTPGSFGDTGYVGYARGREVRVETDPVQPVQLDGEPGGRNPLHGQRHPGRHPGHGAGRRVRHGAIAVD